MATPEQLRQCAAAMLAAADGKEIEYFEENHWYAAHTDAGMWNVNATYRVKPEPKLRPWKMLEVPIGALIRKVDDTTHIWIIIDATFSIIHTLGTELEYTFACCSCEWCWPHEQFDGKWRECGVRE